MNQFVFAILAFGFVQLANTQTACLDAHTTLLTDATCVAAFSAGTDASTICVGSCRNLFDNIICNCDAAVSWLIHITIAIYTVATLIEASMIIRPFVS